jgi:hypothetical protein
MPIVRFDLVLRTNADLTAEESRWRRIPLPWWPGGDLPTWTLIVALLAGAAFWETTPPAEWSDEQIETLLGQSPWVRRDGEAHIYLASAWPLWQAELERRRRLEQEVAIEDGTIGEYFEFLENHRGEYFVLAVHIPHPRYLRPEKETRKMEEKSVLVIGKKKYKMLGHFPPTPDDRFLRMIFPREVTLEDEEFYFDLYVPGVPLPYRRLIYQPQRLTFKGKLEM